VWWLYITWLPLYLYNARGFDLKKELEMFAWLSVLTADAGSLLGRLDLGSFDFREVHHRPST